MQRVNHVIRTQFLPLSPPDSDFILRLPGDGKIVAASLPICSSSFLMESEKYTFLGVLTEVPKVSLVTI